MSFNENARMFPSVKVRVASHFRVLRSSVNEHSYFQDTIMFMAASCCIHSVSVDEGLTYHWQHVAFVLISLTVR